MAQFSYKAIDNEGQEVEGSIEANNLKRARRKLEEKEVHVYELTEATSKETSSFSINLFGDQEKIISFTEQLANLLGAGIQLGEALQIINKLLQGDDFKRVVRDIYDSIKSGQSFAESLMNHPQYFSSSYVSMVRAGEEGGFLELTCRRLAKNLKNRKELKSFIITSLIYPAILLMVTILAVVVMLTYVLPKFVVMYENYGSDLPGTTKLLLAVSDFLTSYGIILLLILGGLVLSGWFYYRTERGKRKIDELLLNSPVLGELLVMVSISKITRNLGTMLESGVPLLKALRFSQNLTENLVIKAALEKAASEVKRGGNLAEALGEAEVFPEAAIYMLGIGERTGKLSSMLLEVADNFEEEYRASLEKMMKIFEPVMILVMGLVIGVIVVAMLLPILKINTISF